MTLEDMKDFLLLPNITFVDLQYTDTSEERANFKEVWCRDFKLMKSIIL